MRAKRVVLALALAAVLGLAAQNARAQIVSGGFVGFGGPSFGVTSFGGPGYGMTSFGVTSFGGPWVAPAPIVVSPVVPVAAPLPYVVNRPVYATPYVYRSWGYAPRVYAAPRYYRGYGRYW